jgi:hypothetical protein
MDLYNQSVKSLVKQLPEDMQEKKKHEEDGTTDAPEYQKIVMAVREKHICTTQPWPEGIQTSFANMEQDPTVYNMM